VRRGRLDRGRGNEASRSCPSLLPGATEVPRPTGAVTRISGDGARPPRRVGPPPAASPIGRRISSRRSPSIAMPSRSGRLAAAPSAPRGPLCFGVARLASGEGLAQGTASAPLFRQQLLDRGLPVQRLEPGPGERLLGRDEGRTRVREGTGCAVPVARKSTSAGRTTARAGSSESPSAREAIGDQGVADRMVLIAVSAARRISGSWSVRSRVRASRAIAAL
jgi:hypothetical protein